MPTSKSKTSQLTISRSSFRKDLRRTERTLVKKVADYVEEPSERNVHDLRTITRRLLAAAELLPKKIRNDRKVGQYESDLKELMKLNAKTRDLDLVLSKIRSKPGEHEQLLAELRSRRDASIQPGLSFAQTLSNLKLPINLQNVSRSGLKKRLEKVSRKYGSKISKRLPTVLTKPHEQKELHLLREDVRNLRYVLSLAEGEPLAGELKTLKSWQSILGDIHDSDVFIKCLSEFTQHDDAGPLINDEEVLRNRAYKKFRTIAKRPLKLSS